ncbi:hypothetical protein ES708_25205 [subsurface metagenome]
MELLIIPLVCGIVLLAFSIPFIIRAKARTRADHIIFGRQPGNIKRINRCISILTWTNKQITIDTDQDTFRILRLRDMLDEIQKPSG